MVIFPITMRFFILTRPCGSTQLIFSSCLCNPLILHVCDGSVQSLNRDWRSRRAGMTERSA